MHAYMQHNMCYTLFSFLSFLPFLPFHLFPLSIPFLFHPYPIRFLLPFFSPLSFSFLFIPVSPKVSLPHTSYLQKAIAQQRFNAVYFTRNSFLLLFRFYIFLKKPQEERDNYIYKDIIKPPLNRTIFVEERAFRLRTYDTRTIVLTMIQQKAFPSI